MRVLERRGRTALGGLTIAVAIVLISATAASAATFPNACKNSVNTTATEIPTTITADAPGAVNSGESFTLSNIQQTATVPSSVFLTGYNLGFLVEGPNSIPANVTTQIAATNTIESSQATNAAASSITSTIDDPDNNPNTGDETAQPGTLDVSYNDQTWTASSGPATAQFREQTVTPLGTGAGALHVGGLKIAASIGGVIPIRFACSPGTVDFSTLAAGVITFDDPAASFASANIGPPPAGAPTANAGADQTVNSGADATLDGSSSSDPDGDPLTYSWAQTGGPTVTLNGANTATPSFTAPTGPATLEFQVAVCDDGLPPLCDTDSVIVNVEQVNEVSLGKAKLDKKKGTAKLPVEVSGAGTVKLKKTSKVGGDSATAEGAGTVKLTVKALGKAKKTLKKKGKVTVKVSVTFDADVGDPVTETTKVVLKKKKN